MMKYECVAYRTTTVSTPYPKYNNCKSPNVRTVLFKRSSISKKCWNADEISLLLSRAIIQNILPRKMPQNMPLLLDYFKMCLKTIKKEVKNFHARKIIATVMIDTIGGYLQSYGLPVIKRMYYEGNLDFDTVNEFFTLQNNFKRILATDGSGWSRPMVIKQKITKVFPLRIPKNVEGDSCKDLITIYDCNVSRTAYINDPSFNQLIIPMPQLDDEKTPQAIGVPLRGHYLYDLNSKEAYDILLIYYTMSIECLHDLKNKTKLNNYNISQDYENYFDYYFFNWIMKYVMPRLHDETWYPGFSSVLRILATIKQNGIPINNPKTIIILKHVNKIKNAIKYNETFEPTFHHRISSHLLWISVFLLLMLVILLLIWIFVILKSRKFKEEEQTQTLLSCTSYESISTSTSAKDTSTSYGNIYVEMNNKQHYYLTLKQKKNQMK